MRRRVHTAPLVSDVPGYRAALDMLACAYSTKCPIRAPPRPHLMAQCAEAARPSWPRRKRPTRLTRGTGGYWLWPWVRASEEGQVPLRDLVLRGGVEQAVAHEVKGADTAGVHHLKRGDNWVTWCAGGCRG